MSRIDWSESELNLLAERFITLRQEDPMEPGLQLLFLAQEALPVERRRPSASTIATYRRVIDVVTPRWAERMARLVPSAPTQPGQITAPQVQTAASKIATSQTIADQIAAQTAEITPGPTSGGQTSAASPQPPAPGPETLVIEIRAEKADLAATLAACPSHVLFGHALERLLARTAGTPAAAREFAAVQVETAATPPPPPAPPVIKAATVIEPAAPVGPRLDVIVLGLPEIALREIGPRLADFPRLRVKLVPQTQVTALPGATPCDHLLLTNSMVTRFQAEQIRRRLGPAASSRVHHFDGSAPEILAWLAKLNAS